MAVKKEKAKESADPRVGAVVKAVVKAAVKVAAKAAAPNPNAVETAGQVEVQAEAQVLEVAVVATEDIAAAEAEVASARATKHHSHAQSAPVQLWNGLEWGSAP